MNEKYNYTKEFALTDTKHALILLYLVGLIFGPVVSTEASIVVSSLLLVGLNAYKGISLSLLLRL